MGIELGIEVEPVSARRLATQNKLLAAARRCIAKYGDAGASVETICEEAGFTKGAFYSNFASKTDIYSLLAVEEYEAILKQLGSLREAALAVAAQEELSAFERIRSALEVLLAALPLDRDFFIVQAEMSLLALRDPVSFADYRSLNEQFLLMFGKTISALVQASGRTPIFPERQLAHAVVALVLRSCHNGVMAGSEDMTSFALQTTAPFLISASE